MRAISRRKWIAAVVVVVIAASAMWYALAPAAAKRDRTGLFTSLPIAWNEAASVGAILQSEEAPHWARGALTGGGRLIPLDTFDEKTLEPLDALVIAQPRPLAPAENVALDAWVRQGGRALLIADPMLTEDSIFSLGDPRRPQPTVLLSPILARWGLELGFDDTQPAGPRVAAMLGAPAVVDLAGRFRAVAGGRCRIEDDGLIARCAVGKGGVVAYADGAVLSRREVSRTQSRALGRLLGAAFPAR